MGNNEENHIRNALIDAQQRQDTPLNGGFGMEIDDFNPPKIGTLSDTRQQTLERFLANNAVPRGCTVDFMPTLPYAGGEDCETIVIIHPPIEERRQHYEVERCRQLSDRSWRQILSEYPGNRPTLRRYAQRQFW